MSNKSAFVLFHIESFIKQHCSHAFPNYCSCCIGARFTPFAIDTCNIA